MLFLNLSAIAEEAFYGKTSFSWTQRGDVSVYGSLDASRAQFENLVLMSDFNFKKVKVTETLTINGKIQGEKLDTNKLVLNGMLEGKKIIIRDGATINGGIDAEQLDIHGYLTINVSGGFKARKSNFEKIKVSAKKIEFNEVILDSIEFDKNDKKPELYLTEGSLVKGDIIFKSGDGIVYKSADSKIEGKVKGGSLKEWVM